MRAGAAASPPATLSSAAARPRLPEFRQLAGRATVAAIEFLPVILLAALGVRTLRNGLALALAIAGVYLLTDVRLASEPVGIGFAFANAALFAAYIVVAHRVSRAPALGGIDGLATAMLIAAVAIRPIGGWGAARLFSTL